MPRGLAFFAPAKTLNLSKLQINKQTAFAGPWQKGFVDAVKAGTLVNFVVSLAPKQRIPDSYLGLSFDTDDVEAIGKPDYISLIKQLTAYGTGPMYVRCVFLWQGSSVGGESGPGGAAARRAVSAPKRRRRYRVVARRGCRDELDGQRLRVRACGGCGRD